MVMNVDRLRGRFRGMLLRPGEEGYPEACRVWNGAVDRHPAMIARCAGTDDVQAAVRYARENELPIAVRGSGHSITGLGVCDDGVVIDLSALTAISADPVARRARAAAGLTWGGFDLATQRYGLATTGGTVSHVGVGGLTLLGGFGHLMRAHGMTVDQVRAVDLVTADGQRLRVDDETEPELFWAVRGGGGSFGIATALTFDLHPVGPMVLGGPVYWPLEQAPEVLRAVRDLAPRAPDELGVMIVAHPAPPLPFLPPDRYGTPALGLLITWAGDPDEGVRVIAPLRRIGTPLGDLVRPVPYRALQSLLDGGAAPGNGADWRSVCLPELTDAAIGDLVEVVGQLPTPFSMCTGWMLGGAAGRVPADATAVGRRESGFELRLIAQWAPGDPGADGHRAWLRAAGQRLRAHGTGRVFPTFRTDEGAGAVYGDALPRLIEVKRRYDPDHIFAAL